MQCNGGSHEDTNKVWFHSDEVPPVVRGKESGEWLVLGHWERRGWSSMGQIQLCKVKRVWDG
jgi:hypothetical protein